MRLASLHFRGGRQLLEPASRLLEQHRRQLCTKPMPRHDRQRAPPPAPALAPSDEQPPSPDTPSPFLRQQAFGKARSGLAAHFTQHEQPESPKKVSPKKGATVTYKSVRTKEENAVVLMRQHAMHFAETDVNDDGGLSFDEFVSSVPLPVRRSTPPSELRAWFELLDQDGNGTVSREEHLRWSLSAAKLASGSGIEKIFARYDRDGSGNLSELEFAKACRDIGMADNAEAMFRGLPGSETGVIVRWRSTSSPIVIPQHHSPTAAVCSAHSPTWTCSPRRATRAMKATCPRGRAPCATF